MSFHLINLNIIHFLEGYHYGFRLQGHHNLKTRLKVPHKDPLSIIQGHMSFIHTRLRISIIHSQEVALSLYMYQVRDTSLPKQDTT